MAIRGTSSSGVCVCVCAEANVFKCKRHQRSRVKWKRTSAHRMCGAHVRPLMCPAAVASTTPTKWIRWWPAVDIFSSADKQVKYSLVTEKFFFSIRSESESELVCQLSSAQKSIRNLNSFDASTRIGIKKKIEIMQLCLIPNVLRADYNNNCLCNKINAAKCWTCWAIVCIAAAYD